MSIHRESGVKLTAGQNEQLRIILDTFLPIKNKSLDDSLISESDLLKTLSYKIIRCNNCERQKGKWLLFHPDFYNSLCLFIDEFVVILSLDGRYDELEKTDCFGINDLILDAPTNNVGGQEMIKPFDKSIFIEFTQKIVKKLLDVYVGGLDEFFDQVHIAAGGKADKMPAEMKQEIMEELVSVEKKMGRKYTQEEIINSTFKIMKNYVG